MDIDDTFGDLFVNKKFTHKQTSRLKQSITVSCYSAFSAITILELLAFFTASIFPPKPMLPNSIPAQT